MSHSPSKKPRMFPCSQIAEYSSSDYCSVGSLAADGFSENAPVPPLSPRNFISLCNDYLQGQEGCELVELAAMIKYSCLSSQNREEIMRQPEMLPILNTVLQEMIIGRSYEASRYGVFILHLFLSSESSPYQFRFNNNVATTIIDMERNDSIPRMRNIARETANKMATIRSPFH
ncbi:hypothetical protein AC1031_008223 [Aphanomyces cochlioides]|nr:hypothetical protein AC1031_008223 [Aphanomyces cochlioides]